MASSPRISTTPVDDDLMYFSPWIISTIFAELRVTARARVSLQECQSPPVPTALPQLMFDFSRRTSPSPEHPAEHVDSAVGEPFRLSMQDSEWEVEAHSAFMQATADYLPLAVRVLFAPAFCRYISTVFGHLPRTDAVLVEVSSLILVSDDSSPIDQLRLALPGEEYSLLYASDDSDDIDDVDSGGRPRPASAASVEGLRTVNVMEEGSCSICLEDFVVEVCVLIMPCSHAFHETCLKKWLGRSHSCPLCRFLLPEAE
ncbi:E3 ubiquitin protein ligase RIE1-like [Zingiber officinale]|uniref:E3 ubiquitin protein ligase RIE1-like n=1 Tax=Zingiber officinale TaxID=94328 RepID=UPI001C4CBB06|nr:E3 ubiquitin protein ligase RIE1-like [Zingiber officinale]